jgi:uncharacterized integral membrane protein
MRLFLLGALAIAVLVALFALQNPTPITITFLFWRFDGSLAGVLLLAFLAGALVALWAVVPLMMKKKRADDDR